MPSVQYLREFINERLTAAAEQIFLEFEKTIVQYEEEIDRQRRLLDITWKPQIKLHTADVPHEHVCKEEEEVLPEQQLWNQERSSSVEQEEPEAPQIKEEQEELCSSQEGEQLGLKEETDTFMVTAAEEGGHSEPEGDEEQLLCHSSAGAESQDQEGGRSADSGPTRIIYRIHCNNPAHARMLARQKNSDAGKKTLKCDVCGRAFKKKCQVKEHRKIHTGEKPHSCKICQRSFTQKSTMLRHMIIHTKEKSYSCLTCGKTFSQSGNLYVHMRIHTGEKPYSCKTCGKTFARSNHMLRHMKTHTGEKS
ncbi:zinc finger protein 550 isoform X1 [Haplochromis burtoni]|uniref:zinc finger protein 550 isoform X1 n=1 Tax=Haplochromis burtoni TaxID=8153 RepID=UPI0006C9B44F|nr:zinc finger protein 550 isoform X1 [Haplochromis burtoni]XP_042071137.1 zinc finger protein 550 isoform X1 [Haplochromis burtoni]